MGLQLTHHTFLPLSPQRIFRYPSVVRGQRVGIRPGDVGCKMQSRREWSCIYGNSITTSDCCLRSSKNYWVRVGRLAFTFRQRVLLMEILSTKPMQMLKRRLKSGCIRLTFGSCERSRRRWLESSGRHLACVGLAGNRSPRLGWKRYPGHISVETARNVEVQWRTRTGNQFHQRLDFAQAAYRKTIGVRLESGENSKGAKTVGHWQEVTVRRN